MLAMFRQLFTVLALLVLLTGGIVGSGTHQQAITTISLPKDGITFVSDRDGNQEIYVMNADGSGQTNLSNSRVSEVRPA